MKAIPGTTQLPAIRALCSTAALLAFAAFPAPLSAQTALLHDTDGRNNPGGGIILALKAGAKVSVGAAKAQSVFVTIDGWVDESRLTGKVDSFPASVDAKAPLRVRAGASATSIIVGELKPHAGVRTLGRSGTWMHVKRGAWISAASLRTPAAPTAAAPRQPEKRPPPVLSAPQASPAPPAAQAQGPPAGAMSVAKRTPLLGAPRGGALGDLAAGTIVEPLARDHGYTKVRVEGWVADSELDPADSTLAVQLTAADLRADPEGSRGKLVRWEVEVLSLQTADPLRRDLARDEPYLLARGPGAENALLYIAVPPSLLNQAKALPPLTRVLITARVRVGRSEPVGTPILDLKTISRR